MKYYTYVEPTSDTDSTPVYTTLSEDEIIKQYWDYFIELMVSRGYDRDSFCHWDCLDHFIVTHWAWESD